MNRLNTTTNIASDVQRELEHGERTSFRFPIQLPIQIIVGGVHYTAESVNFSSSGALLRVTSPIPVGSTIHFLLEVPAGLCGSTAAIDGEGLVVRSYQEDGKNYAAIVINEYRFQ
jgi:hypothetical protein